MPRFRLLLGLVILGFFYGGNLQFAFGQSAKLQSYTVVYTQSDKVHTLKGDLVRLQIQDGDVASLHGYNPEAVIRVEGKVVSGISIANSVYTELSKWEKSVLDTNEIKSSIESSILIGYSRGEPISTVHIYPFRKFQGKWQKLISFQYSLTTGSSKRTASVSGDSIKPQNSVLANGTWMKFPTVKGINKLDYNFLTSTCRIPANTDPRNIKIYGNGGLMIPEDNSIPRPWDLMENAVMFVGEDDGRLDAQDYILMYSTGTTAFNLDSANRRISHQLNLYADTAYYFVTIGTTSGKRVSPIQQIDGVGATSTISTFQDLLWREKDEVNFLRSGRRWFGDMFDLTLNQTFTFNAPGIVPGSAIRLRSMLVTQGKAANGETAKFKLSLSGSESRTYQVNPASNSLYGYVANDELFDSVFTAPNGDNLTLNVSYSKTGSSVPRGYIDYLQFNVDRNLGIYNGQTIFRSFDSYKNEHPEYRIEGGGVGSAMVWNITNPLNPQSVTLLTNGSVGSFIEFKNPMKSINEYIAFSGTAFPVPSNAISISNQNIKGSAVPNLLIVVHPRLKTSAERLATLRRNEGLSVLVVTTDEIYNEFGSGKQDLSAIRDCARYFYKTGGAGNLKYVLLFGSCSYDFKNRMPNNTNLVPIYESQESFDPIDSYASDDFIGLLDDNEGNWGTYSVQYMDIGVGRIVAKNLEEAEAVVDKLYEYKEKKAFGKWRNQVTMLADNGDSDEHMKNCETIWNNLNAANNRFNPNKIYLGSFNQVLGPGGTVSPDCVDALTRAINQGSVIFNYSGHGNEGQWMDEEVVNKESITRWNTNKNYPFFTVGTCSWGRYDDPFEESGGEQLLLQPHGGGIGTITTTRLVTSWNNTILVSNFMNQAFTKTAGDGYARLGDVMRKTKNNILQQSTYGNRNAGLLADPSMKISMPENDVVLTTLNGSSYSGSDSISGLEPIILNGEVRDRTGNVITNFNGPINITLYDKSSTQRTLDGGTSYQVKNNILYNGTAQVVGGRFTSTFVVPADISFSIGKGRFSFYAFDTTLNTDANGADDRINVGGTFPNMVVDTIPPILNAYIDDTTFRNGDVVRPQPNLLIRLKDLSGINLSTSGIGHEMTGVLDGRNNEPFILNSFYTSDPATYQSGWVNYPMNVLSNGRHTLTITAWDSYNNSITKNIEFVVGGVTSIDVSDVSVWPNPSTSSTGNVNFRFSHNQAGKPISVKLLITNSLGQEISTQDMRYDEATQDIASREGLYWNPESAASGMYFYKIIVSAAGAKDAIINGKIVINP